MKRILILTLLLISIPCAAKETIEDAAPIPKHLVKQVNNYFDTKRPYGWHTVIHHQICGNDLYFMMGWITRDHSTKTKEYGLLCEVFEGEISDSGRIYVSKPGLDTFIFKLYFMDLNSDGRDEIIWNDEDEHCVTFSVFEYKDHSLNQIFVLDCALLNPDADDPLYVGEGPSHEFLDTNGDGLLEVLIHCPCVRYEKEQYVYDLRSVRYIYPQSKKADDSSSFLVSIKDKSVEWTKSKASSVSWNEKEALWLDLNGDGILDPVVYGWTVGKVHVGTFISVDAFSGFMKLLSFPIGTGAQNSVCKPFVSLSREEIIPLDPEAGELIGVDKSGKSKGIRMENGGCDSFHIYWNHKDQILDWWRL